MKILGIIPARGGSKGIPKKNTKVLGGKPLIQYTIEAGLKSALISDLVVSTESEEIAELSKELDAMVPELRPKELATDESPTIDTILFTLEMMIDKGYKYDAVCLLQPTTPFRRNGLIDEAINKFFATGADSLVSVLLVPHQYNPHWVFEPNQSKFLALSTGDEHIIPRRQELPPTYIRDGAIYLTSTKLLLEENRLMGQRLAYIETEKSMHVNLDTMDDWHLAETLVKKFSR